MVTLGSVVVVVPVDCQQWPGKTLVSAGRTSLWYVRKPQNLKWNRSQRKECVGKNRMSSELEWSKTPGWPQALRVPLPHPCSAAEDGVSHLCDQIISVYPGLSQANIKDHSAWKLLSSWETRLVGHPIPTCPWTLGRSCPGGCGWFLLPHSPPRGTYDVGFSLVPPQSPGCPKRP